MFTCLWVDACTYARGGGQKRTLGPLLCQLLSLYLLERGSLTEPRARLKARKPQQSFCLCPSPPQHAGLTGIAMPGFLWRLLKTEPRSSWAASAEASPRVNLLRTLNMVSSLTSKDATGSLYSSNALGGFSCFNCQWSLGNSGTFRIWSLAAESSIFWEPMSSLFFLLLNLLSETQTDHNPLALFDFLLPGFTHAVPL